MICFRICTPRCRCRQCVGRGRCPTFFSRRGVVIGFLDRLARPLLRALDPEDAHGLAIKMLKFAPLPLAPRDDKRLALRVFGLNFSNPVGIAAGFDKNAEAADALLRLGFGFVEVGTITPLPQPGNPRPRLFRLDADEGVINRLGFNSEGADAVLKRLAARADAGGIVGINVGANKDSADRVADYVRLIERFAPVASYVTVNISSRSRGRRRCCSRSRPTCRSASSETSLASRARAGSTA